MSDYTVIAPITLETGLIITGQVVMTGQVTVDAPFSYTEVSVVAPVTIEDTPIINAPVSNSGLYYVVAPITIQGGLGPSGAMGPSGATGPAGSVTGGSGFLSQTGSWIGLVFSWSEQPVLVTGLPEGDVYQYAYGDVSRYRLVPTPYSSTGDAFYEDFSGSVLINLVAARGLLW